MTHNTTIVTCFYTLPNNGKHSLVEYKRWIFSFCSYGTEPVVFFVEPGMIAKQIEAICIGVQRPYKIIYRFLDDLAYGSKEWLDYWSFVRSKEPSGPMVCEEMHRIWANKTVFLEEVIRENPFDTQQFVWSDIGCWRGPPVFLETYAPKWPSPIQTLEVLWIEQLNEMRKAFEKASPKTLEEAITNVQIGHVPTVAAAQFGGPANDCLLFCSFMKEGFELYKKHSIVADTDQHVMAHVSLWLEKTYPTSLTNVPSPQTTPLGADRWFAFQFLWAKN